MHELTQEISPTAKSKKNPSVSNDERRAIFEWMENTAERYLVYSQDYIVDFRCNEYIINIENH